MSRVPFTSHSALTAGPAIGNPVSGSAKYPCGNSLCLEGTIQVLPQLVQRSSEQNRVAFDVICCLHECCAFMQYVLPFPLVCLVVLVRHTSAPQQKMGTDSHTRKRATAIRPHDEIV